MSQSHPAVRLRRMQEQDLPEVMAVEEASFRTPWRRSFFETDLARAASYCVVAEHEGRVGGYLILWRAGPEMHLANIAVHKDLRNRGIGRRLVEEAVAVAREVGCEEVCLEVRPSNRAARHLYRQAGFAPAGLRKKYYPDGEDAEVWVRLLTTG